MKLQSVKLVTIIALDSLENQIIADLKDLGVKGYTSESASGEGLHSKKMSDWEGRNIRIEALMGSERTIAVMKKMHDKYFEKFGVVAFVTDVQVLRSEKYT